MKCSSLAAAVSALIPGGGQFLTGHHPRGLLVMAGVLLLGALYAGASAAYPPGPAAAEPAGPPAAVGACFGAAFLALWVWNVYDAYSLGRAADAA
ncbi:hypothetical protein [Meiothermus hypogaeus]|uniref:DUF5683 domain-containing protein n=2 Tax=Meiothermus hypogaeus TaxID=884155 RepID=A0A511QYA7_9DEIN|nr:hypothetical protein [Meiothermus hypogaeus]RIH80454.1 hypothetical protein Mhypo_00581 [Meiothermus hypogaeus]GEM82380.1 hypothetical protein MHY01S_05460 [Meiothermus hypogaeus NBRC 106114]